LPGKSVALAGILDTDLPNSATSLPGGLGFYLESETASICGERVRN